MLPSGARPMKPGTTGTTPLGHERPQHAAGGADGVGQAAAWRRRGGRRSAPPRARPRPGRWRRRCCTAAASTRAESCSPRDTRASRVRGARCRSTLTARHTSRYSVTAASMARWVTRLAARAAQGRPGHLPVARARARRRTAPPRPCGRRRRGAAPSSSRSVTPPRAEATTTSGPAWAAILCAAAVDGLAIGQRGAAEFPDFEGLPGGAGHGNAPSSGGKCHKPTARSRWRRCRLPATPGRSGRSPEPVPRERPIRRKIGE